MTDHAAVVREALGLFYSMAASGEKPSPRSEYVRDESRAALDALVAERDEAVRHQRLNGEQWMARAEAAEAEVARLREALTDQCEMNEQALKELRQLHKEWPLMTEQTNFDGEPLIVEVLRGVIDDLDTGPSRAALGEDA
jgi:hypothetical protein